MPGGAATWQRHHGDAPLPPVSPRTDEWLRAAAAAAEGSYAAAVQEEGFPAVASPLRALQLPPGSQGTLASLAAADAVASAQSAASAQSSATEPLSGASTAPDSVQAFGPPQSRRPVATPYTAQPAASPATSPPTGDPARRRNLLSSLAQQARAAADSPAGVGPCDRPASPTA